MAGICEVTEPPLIEVAPGHLMRCHIPFEELGRLQAKAKPGDVLYSANPQVMTDAEELDAAASSSADADRRLQRPPDARGPTVATGLS